jgi:hypothetical protein
VAYRLLFIAFAFLGSAGFTGPHGTTQRRAAVSPRPPPGQVDSIVFPPGTEIPFRLLQGLQGGRDRAGSVFYAQTLGALARDTCMILAPFLPLRGRIAESRRGWFGQRSELTLRFDSLELAPGVFGPIDAVADSLEYVSPGALGDSGQVYGGRPRGWRAAGGAIAREAALVVGLSVVPVALLEGKVLIRRPAAVRLEAGETGRLRLLAPLALPQPATCERVDTHSDLAPLRLPPFVPRTTDRAGTRATGDPINFVFLGAPAMLDTAFARAGWEWVHRRTARALAKEVDEAIRQRPAAAGAPISPEYFEGRPEDAAYELLGPTARSRHHIRAWRLDDTTAVMVGAANEDVGLDVDPLRGRATHRINPDIDRERDYIVTQLEAGGCADLLDYVRLPGAVTEAKNAAGQSLASDGRAAVVRVGCRRHEAGAGR